MIFRSLIERTRKWRRRAEETAQLREEMAQRL
jgi:hypothetical protein